MNLPKQAIKNAPFVLIMVLIIVVLGAQSLERMPRSEDPMIDLPIYNIVAIYPGTSPKDIENLIINPLEKALEEIEDIDEISSTASEGLANISLQGSFSINPDDKFDEVARVANSIRGELPEGIISFEIRQFSPQNRTVIQQFAMVSESVAYSKLLDYAEDFENELEKIKALSAVDIEAYPQEEIRISIDFQRMANQNIALEQVINQLAQNNANIPGGAVNAQGKTFSLKTTGGYKELADIRNTVINSANGNLVYLKDIATVELDYEDARWVGRYNGTNALFISLKLKKGENILNVAEQINAVAEKFQPKMPGNIELINVFEQAPAVAARINDFFNSLIQGVLLVGCIILVFLGWRSALIIMFIIPLCLLISLMILNGFGFGLQQISIAALVIALGLLVDNGIVVVENITNFIREGMPAREAAAKGTGEVGLAIISSTATTLLSFFPLTQVGEGPGEFLRTLPLTVMIALVVSLILALVLTPILSGKILKIPPNSKPTFIDRILQGLTKRIYRPVLLFSLRKGGLILILTIGITIFSISLFPAIGVSFFPTADKPLLLIDIETPTGTNMEKTNEAVRFVESMLDTMDYVKNYAANIGNGNPQIYYNRIPKQAKKNYGQVLVNFKKWDAGRFHTTSIELREKFKEYPGAKIVFSELRNGTPTASPIEIQIIGDDLDSLKRLAFEVETVLKNTSGIINIDNPLGIDKTDLNINLNKEKAGLVNLSYLNFDRSIRASLTGLQVTEVSLNDGKNYPLTVRIPFDEEPGITDLNKVYLNTPDGGQIPLRQVADIHFEPASSQILHKGLIRYASVFAGVENPDMAVPLTIDILKDLEDIELPEGYSFFASGEYEAQQEAFGDLGLVLILALVGIFAVLVLQFGSILQPIAVFAAIPLAVSGSFIALYITGWSFSFFAFVGFISLIGIVVNSSIIMVDYINQLRAKGVERLQAIQQGSERRLVPIVLTAITTILGLLPLTASATNLWSPLGWTIIGGMISSTLMTLLIVPVLYKWFTTKVSD